MKNFKRILAIVLVVMMVVPMMTTGLTVSAATAEAMQGQYSAGVTFAGGNWKAYSYNDWSKHMGEALAAFDDLANVSVDAEGQIVLSNQIQYGFNSYQTYGWVNQNVMNVLQATNTTAIDGLFVRNGMMAQAQGSTVFSESLSYAFSENQLLGTLSTDVYTKEEGFAVEGGMVTDGLVISMYNNDNDIMSNGSVFNVITAYVMDGGKIVSSQSFDTEDFGKDFGLCTGHAHNTFFSFVDGVVTYHVEDNYSANGAYFNQTYTFDELDTSSLSANKDYYFCVGSKGEGADGVDGSVNINLARIGTFTIDADGLYATADGENKNIADWTGHGTVACAHETWSDWAETLAPSCTTTGVEERTCLGCGKVEVNTISALGHTWGAWTVDVDPDCTNTGSKSRVCATCGDVDDEVIPADGHSWSDWYETVAATCTTDGMEQRDCSVCSDYEENVLDALGHDWAWDVLPTYDVNGQRTCARCVEVEADLAYDISYYWTFASDNKVGNIDAAYADYNDEYAALVDGSIELQDMSLAYGGDYNYYPMLKATSKFTVDLEGFYATVEAVASEDLTIPYQYPTTLSFLWSNYGENYDDANEYSVYNPGAVGLGTKLAASRYGHIYNNYLAGEYSYCVVLADTSQIYSPYDYGTPNDGIYDWMYTSVVSNGNYWTTKMDMIAVDATQPITVGLLYEFDPSDAARESAAYVDINGELYCPGVGMNHQLTTKSYYFSVAAYGDGVNEHTASFKITDVCGQEPALFNGHTHECYTEHFETEATCTDDGYSADICLACKEETNVVVTPATGHTLNDEFVCDCGYAAAASIGEEGFDTLEEAIDAAKSGDTIVLRKKNENGPYTIPKQKNISIDLNGFNIRNKSGDALIVDEANVYIYATNGGTVRSSDGVAIVVKNGGYVTICDAMTIRCSSEEGFDVFSIDDASTVEIFALGGRYYKDPTAAGAILIEGLAISGEGTNWTVVLAEDECSHNYVVTEVVEPTCTENGYSVYTCEICGDFYTADEIAAAHAWGAWNVTVKPTYYEEGEESRTCEGCGETETRVLAKKEYLITFDTMGGTMPEGVPTEFGINYQENYKEAAGFDYPIPTYDEGGYVFDCWYWPEYNYFLTTGDWNGGYYAITWSITVEAVWMECPGHVWTEWAVDEAAGTQSRTCTVCNLVETEELAPAVELNVTAAGNVISVVGLTDDVKDVYISAGAWETYAQMKPNKVFSITPANKRVVDGAFDYTVAENGTYTVMVRYNDGTMEAKVFVVDCYVEPASDLVVDGNTVTVSNLENLLVLRYVAGEYETSAQIKRAEGVVNVPYYSKKIVDNSFTVELAPGTYTFVTQFKDETFVYYTVVIEDEAPVVVKDWKITFDTVGGEMPEGVPTEIGINYMENYKEAAGFDYPIPTLEGYVFDGWLWNEYNYWLTEGDWNGGWYAVEMDIVLEAVWVEA